MTNMLYHWFCLQTDSSPGPCSHSSGCRCNLHKQRGQRLRRAWRREKQTSASEVRITQLWVSESSRGRYYMALMFSVRLASKVRNCFPFFVNPRTWEPEQTKIFSCGVPAAPPRSILDIFCPGSVLNTGWNRKTNILLFETKNKHIKIKGL